jgi:hypothetical protein
MRGHDRYLSPLRPARDFPAPLAGSVAVVVGSVANPAVPRDGLRAGSASRPNKGLAERCEPRLSPAS